MPDRNYYREHRESLRAAARAWKEANPERTREINREYMRRAAVRKKAIERRRAHGRAWYAEHQQQGRERARRFRHEHPERVQEYQARFRERHPERAAEQNRRATEKWRDGRAEALREQQRVTAGQRRTQDPDAFRRWYRANLQRQRERGREASRLRSRLKKLGLPPRRVQRVYASDRRANERASDEFFTRRRTKVQKDRLQAERDTGFYRTSAVQRAVLDARRRITGSQELHDAARQLQQRLRREQTRDLALAFFPETASRVMRERGATVRSEIEMDSIARQLRGVEAYDVEAELRRRVGREAGATVVDLARRSSDETHMRRLIDAKLPATAKRHRDRSGAGQQGPQRADVEEPQWPADTASATTTPARRSRLPQLGAFGVHASRPGGRTAPGL